MMPDEFDEHHRLRNSEIRRELRLAERRRRDGVPISLAHPPVPAPKSRRICTQCGRSEER